MSLGNLCGIGMNPSTIRLNRMERACVLHVDKRIFQKSINEGFMSIGTILIIILVLILLGGFSGLGGGPFYGTGYYGGGGLGLVLLILVILVVLGRI